MESPTTSTVFLTAAGTGSFDGDKPGIGVVVGDGVD